MITYKTCGIIGYSLLIMAVLMFAAAQICKPLTHGQAYVFAGIFMGSIMFAFFFLSFYWQKADFTFKQ